MVTVTRYGHFWAVYEDGELLCVTVYKKGAAAVVDRLTRDKEPLSRAPRSEAGRSAEANRKVQT